MNYIVFKNKGEIDVNYLSLLGVSTKEGDDTKIGFWGSGLKYALATLLRNGINVRVFSGEDEIVVEEKKINLGEQEVGVIYINGEKTSITTKAGKDWDIWFAIREIHSNQIDCGNNKISVSNNPKGSPGETNVFVELTDEINQITKSYDKYFSFKREPLFENSHGKMFTKIGSMYRQGIRSNDQEYNSALFDYDFNKIDINESRVFNYSFQVRERIASIFSGCSDFDVINAVFSNIGCLEQNADFCNVSYFSKEIINYLKNFILVKLEISGYSEGEVDPRKRLIIGNKIFDALYKKHKKDLNFFGDTNTSLRHGILPDQSKFKEQIDGALNSLGESTHDVVVGVMEGDTLGEYDPSSNKIILDVSVFESTKLLQNTLLEEILHKESGASDKTRRFQNHIINRLRIALTK